MLNIYRSGELRVNDKDYVSKMVHILSQVLNKLPKIEELRKDNKINEIDTTIVELDGLNPDSSKVMKELNNLLNENKINGKNRKYISDTKSPTQQVNDILEIIWKQSGFTRGAVIIQGISIKLDENHNLKPYLHQFCINEFSKLAKYGLLETDNDNPYKYLEYRLNTTPDRPQIDANAPKLLHS